MHTAPPCTVQISRRADAQEELEEVDTCTRDTSTCSRARRIGKRPTTANFRVMDACNVIGCGPGIDCRCHRPRPKPRSARTECTTSSAARSAQCAPSAARRPMSLARPRAALRASGPARSPRAVARKPARRAAARCAARREAQVREIASSPGGLGRGASRRPAATRPPKLMRNNISPPTRRHVRVGGTPRRWAPLRAARRRCSSARQTRASGAARNAARRRAAGRQWRLFDRAEARARRRARGVRAQGAADAANGPKARPPPLLKPPCPRAPAPRGARRRDATRVLAAIGSARPHRARAGGGRQHRAGAVNEDEGGAWRELGCRVGAAAAWRTFRAWGCGLVALPTGRNARQARIERSRRP